MWEYKNEKTKKIKISFFWKRPSLLNAPFRLSILNELNGDSFFHLPVQLFRNFLETATFPGFHDQRCKTFNVVGFFHLEPLFIEKLSSFGQNFQTCRESCRSLLSGWLGKRRSCSKLVLTTTLLKSFRSSASVSYRRSRRLLIGWCLLSLNNGTFDEPLFFSDDVLVYL